MNAALLAPVIDGADTVKVVTLRIGKQLFGIPVQHVRDVLHRQPVTRIPLAPPQVLGAVNLRGRIVTVIDMRRRLELPARAADAKTMFIVVEHKNELYSLVVDSVGEVLPIAAAATEKVPSALNGWQSVASGIAKLDGALLVLVDVPRLIGI